MSKSQSKLRAVLMGTVAAFGVLAVGASSAIAGGFAIREQSAESQGASFAGNAAGTGLSVMYWNPAGVTNKTGPGINLESNYSLIIPHAEVTADSVSLSGAADNALFAAAFAASGSKSGEIADLAVVPSSYASMQLSPTTFLGVSINSGFGLATEPKNQNYDGSILARRSSLFTTGITPTIGFNVAPGISIGGGLQVNWARGVLKFATVTPQQPSSSFSGDDFAFGGTAGIMLTPASGTRIGLGWRSSLTHNLEGDFFRPATPFPAPIGPSAAYKGTVDLKLPDVITLSLNQKIANNMRLLGTVEWSNWSQFSELRVRDRSGAAVPAGDLVIPANWNDGWFFSVGAEYDYSQKLTLRTGIAYEISPIDDPSKRIVSIPDADRVWLSIGGNYKLSETMSVDLGYSHVFVEDSRFDRSNTSNNINVKGSVEASVDIVSIGLKSKF